MLFNDRIDIYCNPVDDTTPIDRKTPDGTESRREFSFYEVKMTVEIDRHTFGGEVEEMSYAISLWI